jgi:hypothetical protein
MSTDLMRNRPESGLKRQVETCSLDGVINYTVKLCKLKEKFIFFSATFKVKHDGISHTNTVLV